ncbi:MAG TPA: hypothetical protein PKY10_05510 [Lentisphaeria bacterium]|nr:hypothetical protein [Lentisphaeria bacterium]
MAIISARFFRISASLVSAVVLHSALVSRSELAVVLNPPEVVLAGCGWQVADGPWNDSGVQLELPVGTHVVTFRPLEGWVAPLPWTVAITDEERSSTILATYSKTAAPEAQIHLVLDVTGAVSGRRHPLTLSAVDQADDAYHPAEDIGVYLPYIEGWSSLAMTTAGVDDGLFWDTRALRPETTWTITGIISETDPLTLAWRTADLPGEVAMVMTGAILPAPIDMAATTSWALTSPGPFRIQVQARHPRLRSTTYILEAGWNTIGVVHQLLDTSARRLADMRPWIHDDATGALIASRDLPPGAVGWVFVPTKTKLELLGTDTDDGRQNTTNLQSGWSFETVFTPTPPSADCSAWRWRRRRFVLETNELTPGVGYWIYRP